MTEGQDATAAPAVWSGARQLPAGLHGDGRREADAADAAWPGARFAAAPVPVAATTSTPNQGTAPLTHGGTGWPAPETGQPGTSQPGASEPGASESGASDSGAIDDARGAHASQAGTSGAQASQAGPSAPNISKPGGRRPPAGRHDGGAPEIQPTGRRGGRHAQAASEDTQPASEPAARTAAAAQTVSRSSRPAAAWPASAAGAPTSAGPTPAAAGSAEPPSSRASRSPSGPSRAEPGGIWAAHAEPPKAARRSQGGPSHGTRATDHDESGDEPFARVDARKLEAALLGLRHPIVTVPLLFEAPGVADARAERVKLLSQIDDYLLPRLRQSGAPILVALVGSTGAGKSTLMNSLVGKQVSATGIRRPTTNSPVLACHPDDVRWFAENVFLPTMPRVRQQGLAMPGRDGLLVLAASEGMPKGVALLDTPDIDSVVQAHRDFAHQFLDASDLWLFVTTARRYADAAVWEMLKDARDRGAALAVALSRVPASSSAELAAHFDAMLEANGLREVRRFSIPETIVTEAQLPGEVAAPIRDWLADTARREDRRVAVLTQTMSGVLDTFRSRVPALADQVDEQLELRRGLRDTVDAAYSATLAEFDEATRDGALLRGEVQARWRDFAGTGDLVRTLQVRRGRGSGKQKKQRLPARATALKEALRTSVESLIAASADRAAELVVTQWRRQAAGARLLADIDATSRRGGVGTEADFVASALADLGVANGTSVGGSRQDSAALARATAGLTPLAERVVASWQEHVLQLVKQENVTKRSIARVVSFDDESLALVLSIGILGYTPEAEADDGTATAPQRLLESLLGAGLLRDMGTRLRQDLRDRVSDLFEAEARRYFAIVDSAGVPAATAAAELLQAGYALEAAR